MRTPLAWLPALLCALAPGISHALTLAEAHALARTHNPELAQARLELQALQAAETQAGARPNPELGVLVEDTRSATRTTTVQWAQPLEMGAKRAARQAAAALAREQAGVALAAREADLIATVTATFHEVLGAQAQRLQADEALAIAARAAEAARKRLQAGKVPPLEVAKAQVAQAAAQADLAQADADLALARARLAALGIATAASAATAEGDATALPGVPDAQRLAEALPDAPALQLARLDIARRQALSDGERARRVPDLTVTVGAKREAETGRTLAVVGLSLPLPLADRNTGALLEALRREDQAREALNAATLKLQFDVTQALTRLRLSREQARRLADDALPTAQAAHDTALRGYELGKFSFLDVLDAQRTLAQLRRERVQHTTDAHRAAADLARLLGSPSLPTEP
ncbi:MAG: TolC family protein [Pelomonas sp.]|nr:TolC family protein [Roseateles sp.]